MRCENKDDIQRRRRHQDLVISSFPCVTEESTDTPETHGRKSTSTCVVAQQEVTPLFFVAAV